MNKNLEEYNKELMLGMRAGYTTGSCACAASKAALLILLGEEVDLVRIDTPAGISLDLDILNLKIEEDSVSLAIKKYSGDDPDVTDGILIYAKLSFIPNEIKANVKEYIKENNKKSILRTDIKCCCDIEDKLQEAVLDRDINIDDKNIIYICGGIGVGKLTKKGLDRYIGEAAINSVPRNMIREHLKAVLDDKNIEGDILVEIFVPEGEEVSKRTFNKRLGIEGGISILGTSGIVTPMSKSALIDTIKVDMKSKRENSEYIVAVPGNYGMDYIANKFGFDKGIGVEFSNYIGEAIDFAINLECKGLLLVGHIGKFVKLAGGIMNTHSNDADARAELMAAHLLKCDLENIEASKIVNIAKEILSSNTTDESVGILKREGILKEVMSGLGQSMYKYARQRANKALILGKKMMDRHGINDSYYDDENKMKIAILSFTLEEGELLRVGDFDEILSKIKNK